MIYKFGTVACACLDTSRRRQLAPKTRFARFGVPRKLRRAKHTPKTKKTGTNETQYRQRTGGGARPLADTPVVSSADEKLRC